jgi:hypothetical protein
MEQHMSQVTEKTSIQFTVKRPPRFKAGAESSSAVNLVAIDVVETTSADFSTFGVTVNMESTYATEDPLATH